MSSTTTIVQLPAVRRMCVRDDLLRSSNSLKYCVRDVLCFSEESAYYNTIFFLFAWWVSVCICWEWVPLLLLLHELIDVHTIEADKRKYSILYSRCGGGLCDKRRLSLSPRLLRQIRYSHFHKEEAQQHQQLLL